MVPFGKRPKTLPVVLGRHEVNELLACTKNLKQRTFITTLYATGMRFSEAANLHIHDIDSQRMQIRITNGKGAKQRQVPLSPRLLSELREYWRHYKPTSLLFFGKTPETTYCDTSIQKAIKASARLAGKCSGGKRVDFNDKASKLILPGVTYYQVVCTLPSELSELALTNRQVMADLLVDSAWKNSDGYYLVDGEGLREAYRKHVISATYIQPLPTETSRADQVVNYLTRYLTGGPISNQRIVAANRDWVTFLAREGKRAGSEREQIEVTLPTTEFVQRWCLHIQPDLPRFWVDAPCDSAYLVDSY
jgi:Phage integrase family/Putative transposase